MITLRMNLNFVTSQANTLLFLVLAVLFESSYLLVRQWAQKRSRGTVLFESVILAFMITMIVFFRGPEKEFIYFQF